MNSSYPLFFSPEVKQAFETKYPVVALESTIIAHGMPYPKNVETAKEVEDIIRNAGAIPATIAILNGDLCVGLNESQLNNLGSKNDIWKVSLRDLPYVVSKKLNGATTVAATMRIAAMAGIKIFVTGGIGGVHRGAETSFDISADLTELSQTDVAVVSAGVKSILDIGLTLETLETLGVPVVTVGSNDFPSFYSRSSGHKTPLRLDTPEEIAGLINSKWAMGIQGSVLIANPIPPDKEVPHHEMEKYITLALTEAAHKGIQGKEITPFLLKYIAEATGGESLEANIELVKNNALVGARIAKALSENFETFRNRS
ncbi:MAG TPA: pseudouridine-5'-phosphate glycosidase [Bacteroidia bacterium]|nr:pseudouridine-5'-phosphate glycosidase [Bacteroidia bacterium]